MKKVLGYLGVAVLGVALGIAAAHCPVLKAHFCPKTNCCVDNKCNVKCCAKCDVDCGCTCKSCCK